MTYVCLIVRTVYGTSGSVLPPPCISSATYREESLSGELLDDFKSRMAEAIMKLRQAAAAQLKPYSCADGWNWQFPENKLDGLPTVEEVYGERAGIDGTPSS